MTVPSRILLTLTLLVVPLLGCSSQSKTASIVSGKVTYKGQPVSGGTITFYPPPGEEIVASGDSKASGAYGFTLNDDGTFIGAGLPAQEMVVTVETESLNPNNKPKANYGKGKGNSPDEYRKQMMKRGAAPDVVDTRKYVAIPKKYANKKTSPLKKTLTAGKNEFDVELTD